MEFIQLIIISIIQGITEFLPISSSAHLILLPVLMRWSDQGLAIDVAAHLGSLFAVIFYFRKEMKKIVYAGVHSMIKQKIETKDAWLFWSLIMASVPVLATGFLLRDIVSIVFRDPLIIAIASISFGLLLWYADANGTRLRRIEQLTLCDAVIIGMAQALALVPGISRSGITITAGLILGLDRISSARFSILMAVPIILVASTYESLKLVQMNAGVDIINFIITVILSAISAFFAIYFFLKFLDKVGMLPFVIYRVILGIVLIVIFIE